MSHISNEIKKHHSTVFRRCYIKRRDIVTGQFESDWFEVTDDVKKWGSYTTKVDAEKPNKFSFGNATLVFANDEGKYNPEDDELSLWYGNYISQQRTLVKIESGFLVQREINPGHWLSVEAPAAALWDSSPWDEPSEWDSTFTPITYTGIISGDVNLSAKNEVAFTIRPVNQVFIDYPAKALTGWTSTGLTASQFITMLRDQTDGSSNYVFRPFFQNTSTGFDISTTSSVFGQLNTSTAVGVIDKNVWQIIEKLAEAESFVPYTNSLGQFRFISRTANTSAAAFEFYGSGSHSAEYGNTFKDITKFGKKISKYYSRVQVKWVDADTASSYEVVESSLVVSGSNNPWGYGARSLEVENFFIPTSTVANTVATTLFTEHSSLKNEIEFKTSFIPHLDILDRVKMYYDSPPNSSGVLWDQNNWSEDATETTSDLTWDVSTGDAIRLTGQEYKFLSISINLDKFECSFVAREI